MNLSLIFRRMLALTLLCLFSFSWAHADIIVFHDGRELEGEIIGEEKGYYIIKGRFGKTKINKREVKEIRKVKSPRQVAEGTKATLIKVKGSADAWFELGQFAEKNRLLKFTSDSYKRAIQTNPNHERAHKALGHVRYLGEWIPLEQKMRLEGKKKVNGRWVDPNKSSGPNGNRIKPYSKSESSSEKETPTTESAIREKMRKLTGIDNYSAKDEKQVDCPKCKGSKFNIWLDCNNCNKSDKPGYKFTGMGYILCNRCNGKTRFPGMSCSLCKKTGKVYLSRVHPMLGGTKKAPTGYRWCGTCHGAKYGETIPCNQCKRSQYPGYTYHGDTISVCNRCRGFAVIPLSNCATCKGTGTERNK